MINITRDQLNLLIEFINNNDSLLNYPEDSDMDNTEMLLDTLQGLEDNDELPEYLKGFLRNLETENQKKIAINEDNESLPKIIRDFGGAIIHIPMEREGYPAPPITIEQVEKIAKHMMDNYNSTADKLLEVLDEDSHDWHYEDYESIIGWHEMEFITTLLWHATKGNPDYFTFHNI